MLDSGDVSILCGHQVTN